MDMNMKTKVDTKTRVETLYYFIYEMSDAFGADLSCLESIKKGVLERQVLSQIYLNYLNKNGEIIGQVIIDIDWEKHKLLATTDYGSTFQLDPQKSVKGQISEMSDIIISHVNMIRKTHKVIRVSSSFRYLKEIESDPVKNKEVMAYLGHEYGKKRKEKMDPVFNQTLTWMIDKLNEVTITVSNK